MVIRTMYNGLGLPRKHNVQPILKGKPNGLDT